MKNSKTPTVEAAKAVKRGFGSNDSSDVCRISGIDTPFGSNESSDVCRILPAWCSTDCQHLDLAELPGGQQACIPGCFREDGGGGWVWSRLDKMNGCPIIRLQLPRLPAWCSRQCPYYHANLSGAQLVERCHWQDKTGRHWVRLRIEQLRRCPAKTEKSNRIKN
ncbi:MAG: hypothetical protein GX087_05730 [Desulfobulbaceae bacterium]|nr:hypothetical protein [Desulfobulbaceae bacterium]